MMRPVAIGIAVASLALFEGRARADACLCLGPELPFDAADQVETADAYVDPAEVGVWPHRTLAPAAPVLWCVAADDPRCSRDDEPGQGSRLQVLATPTVLAWTTAPRVGPPGSVEVRWPAASDHGRAGVRARIDRPPRR